MDKHLYFVPLQRFSCIFLKQILYLISPPPLNLILVVYFYGGLIEVSREEKRVYYRFLYELRV